MSSKGLLRYVRACAICESELPLGSSARRRGVHETGIPWNDASGDRLRDWLKLDRPAF
jgi:hypothetical protein